MRNPGRVMPIRIRFIFFCLFVLLSSGSIYGQHSGQKLVAEFDCTREYPVNTYFSHGKIQVSGSSAGRYREAEAIPLSRLVIGSTLNILVDPTLPLFAIRMINGGICA